jgi:hypothetical protein
MGIELKDLDDILALLHNIDHLLKSRSNYRLRGRFRPIQVILIKMMP